MGSIDVLSVPGEASYEEMKGIDQNPRPKGYVGVWGNGTNVVHWVGAKSGLRFIEHQHYGGARDWFLPNGRRLDWGYRPEMDRVTKDRFWERFPDSTCLYLHEPATTEGSVCQ